MNQATEMLFAEHHVIANAIDTTRQLRSLIGRDNEQYEKTLTDLIRFFRNYADHYHHHKEEQILFPEMIKKNELLDEGLVKEMFENHEEFRVMVREAEQRLAVKDYPAAQKQMEKYGEVLLNHIAVENEEVFPIAETLFNADELEKIYYRFCDSDQEIGDGEKEKLVAMEEDLRRAFA